IEANDEALIEANDEPLAAAEDDELPSATFDDDPVMTTDDVDAGNITLDDDAVVVDDNDVEEETVVAGTEDEPDLVVVEDEPTQHVDMDDMEATQAVPVAAAAPVGQEHAAHGLYRVAGAEETAVISDGSYPNQDADVAEERQQAQLEAERQAREQRLGAVQTSSDNAIREDAKPVKIVTDKVLPSFGLFVLRIVTAGILGIASYQILGSGVDATADYLGQTMIPEPRLVAWILGFTLGAMALLLVIGMLQRLVGLLLLAVAVGSLIFIRWGNFAIFNPAVEGFIGDKDLLLAAVGLLLFTIGGGAWGVDGAFRRTRASSKAEREG
ncbi:MAG: DoxX family protein, partial [Propionibacteriaceae bacterium]|nr:DoxX family protein [Propionibacteriaceae bacterium]